jgi:hypothetical protein
LREIRSDSRERQILVQAVGIDVPERQRLDERHIHDRHMRPRDQAVELVFVDAFSATILILTCRPAARAA